MTDLNDQAFKAAKNAFHDTYATPDGPLRGAIAAYVAALPTPSPSTLVQAYVGGEYEAQGCAAEQILADIRELRQSTPPQSKSISEVNP